MFYKKYCTNICDRKLTLNEGIKGGEMVII